MDFRKIFKGFIKQKSNVAGFDIGSTCINSVRMHKSGDTITLLTASTIELGKENTAVAKSEKTGLNINIPSELQSQYACLAIPAPHATIKLLSFPGQPDEKMEEKILSSMGIKNHAEFRINYKVTSSGDAHSESRILTVAIKEKVAQQATSLFAYGLPVPHTLEVSGLATITAFLHGPGSRHKSDVIGVIEFGTSTSTFALFNHNNLALLRRFNFGTDKLILNIQETLGVDEETASSILAEGSFDISQVANTLLTPIVNQLVVSRDFIERRENCKVSNLYVSGGIITSHNTIETIRKAMGIDVHTWVPTENITIAENAIPAELEGQEWRFAAAIGACLATLEKS